MGGLQVVSRFGEGRQNTLARARLAGHATRGKHLILGTSVKLSGPRVSRACVFFSTFLPLTEIRNFSQIYSVVRALAQFLFCFESLFPCVVRFPQHPPPLTNLLPVLDVHMTSWLPSCCFKGQYHLSGTQVG